MKKLFKILSVGVLFFWISGCMNTYNLLTSHVDNNVSPKKIGTSSASTIFFVANIGNASVQSAIEDGKIKKVHHIESQNSAFLLGLVYVQRTIVYGE